MILEGIVTTTDVDGGCHVAPMGPLVDSQMQRLVLRPYRSSRTYQNLKRRGEGVFHITDDVELLARAAVDRMVEPPRLAPGSIAGRFVLADACRWYAFHASDIADEQDRTTMECTVVDSGWLRDFVGFNRAKHAVLEAAILATRIAFLPAAEIFQEMKRLAVIVEKTGGDQERRAFDFLHTYLTSQAPDRTAGIP